MNDNDPSTGSSAAGPVRRFVLGSALVLPGLCIFAVIVAMLMCVVFGLVALTTFSSGWLQSRFGWQAVNLAGVVPLAAVIVGILWLRRRRPSGLGAAPA